MALLGVYWVCCWHKTLSVQTIPSTLLPDRVPVLPSLMAQLNLQTVTALDASFGLESRSVWRTEISPVVLYPEAVVYYQIRQDL